MRRRRVAKQTPGRVALPLVLLAAAGCHSAATQRQRLDSSYPPDQIAAAVWLADARDAEAVPRLVRLLEDRDRTVRMYAILALERLSGQTYGYKYYAPEPQRREAVRHWQQALRRGELAVGQVPPESQAEPTSAAPPHQPKGGPGRAAWPAGEEKRVP